MRRPSAAEDEGDLLKLQVRIILPWNTAVHAVCALCDCDTGLLHSSPEHGTCDWGLMLACNLACTSQDDFVSASRAPSAKLTRVARRAHSATADAGGEADQQRGAAECGAPGISSEDRTERPAPSVEEPGVAVLNNRHLYDYVLQCAWSCPLFE